MWTEFGLEDAIFLCEKKTRKSGLLAAVDTETMCGLVWIVQKQVVPFLTQAFGPIAAAIFHALAAAGSPHCDSLLNDEEARLERQSLRRSYFSFVAAVAGRYGRPTEPPRPWKPHAKPDPNLAQPSEYFIGPNQTHYKPTTNPLQTRYKPTTNPLQTHYKPTTNPLQTHFKPITNPLQTHCKPSTTR